MWAHQHVNQMNPNRCRVAPFIGLAYDVMITS